VERGYEPNWEGGDSGQSRAAAQFGQNNERKLTGKEQSVLRKYKMSSRGDIRKMFDEIKGRGTPPTESSMRIGKGSPCSDRVTLVPKKRGVEDDTEGLYPRGEDPVI